MGVTSSALLAALLTGGQYMMTGPYSPVGGSQQYGSPAEMSVHGFAGQSSEQLYPYESPAPWQHGRFQEIPAYGGHHYFRPYNYKHVLSQSQTAAGFGMSPVMPYSQQFWHRYENGANLDPFSNEERIPAEMPATPHGYNHRMGAAVPMPSAMLPPTPGDVQQSANVYQHPAPMQPQQWPVIVPASGELPETGPVNRWNPSGR